MFIPWLRSPSGGSTASGWSGRLCLAALLLGTTAGRVSAQDAAGDAPAGEAFGASTRGAGPREGDPEDQQEEEDYGATARVGRSRDDGDARSGVSRRQMEERLPRSSPDALRYEPGVYVQQTAHGQASPYVRAMTGQQVVHLFDGVRMNNGIYRQGPNQYFFTVDSRTVRRLDVLRGSASTLYGSDALGGAILATPVEPWLDDKEDAWELHPRFFGRFASADFEIGGRGEVEARLGRDTALLAGVGYRDVGQLESGGVVRHLREPGGAGRGAVAPWVPRFAEELDPGAGISDWRTQLGTGFRELTFDGRVVRRLAKKLRLVTALYAYRQSDAPRTDACPPPEAPLSECLTIAAQRRTLAYAALRGDAGRDLRDLDLILSFQRHHEARVRDRPGSFVRFDFGDDVDTLGLAFSAATRDFGLGRRGRFKLRYGVDVYRDGVDSSARQSFTDLDLGFPLSRGQYLDGSLYVQGGAFLEVEATPVRWLTLRGGGRGALVGIRAPGDPESGTRRIRRGLGAVVGRIGAELRATEEVSVLLNVDQGFRAPNLDDLTSRQQTGPGFQFENPDLGAEHTLTFELGTRADLDWLRFDLWAFATLLEDAVLRSVRESADCPPATPECSASRNQLQLVNAHDTSLIVGAEGGATVTLPADVAVRAALSWAWGEAPNTGSRPGDPAFGAARVPLSRVPPLNGTVEALYRHVATGFYGAAAIRWALSQTRLAPSDVADPRVPVGGTPGYAVLDLRAGVRWADHFRLSFVFENVFDAAWRAHGSSVNGPGRGLITELMVGY